MPDPVCAMCGLPSATIHHLSLDGGRKGWLVCCLCVGELAQKLDAGLVTGGPRP